MERSRKKKKKKPEGRKGGVTEKGCWVGKKTPCANGSTVGKIRVPVKKKRGGREGPRGKLPWGPAEKKKKMHRRGKKKELLRR